MRMRRIYTYFYCRMFRENLTAGQVNLLQTVLFNPRLNGDLG